VKTFPTSMQIVQLAASSFTIVTSTAMAPSAPPVRIADRGDTRVGRTTQTQRRNWLVQSAVADLVPPALRLAVSHPTGPVLADKTEDQEDTGLMVE
jgi:hypothetical protein